MGGELAGLGLEDHGAHDVGREEVGGELDALELDAESGAEALDEEGFGEAGHALEQDMAIGQERNEQALDDIGLADDGLVDFLMKFLRPGGTGDHAKKGMERETGKVERMEDSLAGRKFRADKRAGMDLPTQIERRLARLGVHPGTVEERFVRGAGSGGQKINKTSSTVTLRHEATGVGVRCQAGRSQAANRARAWELLCEKLEARRVAARAVVASEQAAERARKRRPSAGARRRNVAEKRRRGEVKAARGRIVRDE